MPVLPNRARHGSIFDLPALREQHWPTRPQQRSLPALRKREVPFRERPAIGDVRRSVARCDFDDQKSWARTPRGIPRSFLGRASPDTAFTIAAADTRSGAVALATALGARIQPIRIAGARLGVSAGIASQHLGRAEDSPDTEPNDPDASRAAEECGQRVRRRSIRPGQGTADLARRRCADHRRDRRRRDDGAIGRRSRPRRCGGFGPPLNWPTHRL